MELAIVLVGEEVWFCWHFNRYAPAFHRNYASTGSDPVASLDLTLRPINSADNTYRLDYKGFIILYFHRC